MKEKILQAAGELFMKYGVRSVTMEDIARSLSISKKTIYQYFEDKDDVVKQSTQTHMDMEKQEYDEIFESSHDAVEELAKVCQCMRKNFREINPSMLYDLRKYHHSAWEIWSEFKDVYIKNSIARNLKRGIEEGFFRKEIDPETLAIFRVSQVEMVFDEKVFPRNQFDFREVHMELFDHYVHGIVTEKGLKLYEDYLAKETEQINNK